MTESPEKLNDLIIAHYQKIREEAMDAIYGGVSEEETPQSRLWNYLGFEDNPLQYQRSRNLSRWVARVKAKYVIQVASHLGVITLDDVGVRLGHAVSKDIEKTTPVEFMGEEDVGALLEEAEAVPSREDFSEGLHISMSELFPQDESGNLAENIERLVEEAFSEETKETEKLTPKEISLRLMDRAINTLDP